jgi:hypothetical protein
LNQNDLRGDIQKDSEVYNKSEECEYNTDISIAKQSNSMPQQYTEKSNSNA